ncbi:MAG TPA: hypothetical protein VFX08_10040 [Gaiella sp.]|nr:hypothetical protein [Gaiella sp.]
MRFEYRLAGTGWAEAQITDDHASASLTASYLSDALGDLLAAVRAVRTGSTEVRCSWEEEPGEYRWVFRRSRDDIALRILWFDDQYDSEADETGRVVFETTQKVDALVAAIASAAQRVLDEHGEAGYVARWVEHAFPTAVLLDLQA